MLGIRVVLKIAGGDEIGVYVLTQQRDFGLAKHAVMRNGRLPPTVVNLQQVKKPSVWLTAEVVSSSILNRNGCCSWKTVIYETERQRIVNQRNDHFGFNYCDVAVEIRLHARTAISNSAQHRPNIY